MKTVLITGANRGLGLEFVRQYGAMGWRVLAACRAPKEAKALSLLAGENLNISLLALNVALEEDINALAQSLTGQTIDHLILNAGVLGEDCATLGSQSQAAWLDVLNINTVAPALLIQALKDNVVASEEKVIVGISSRVGSIGDNSSGNMFSYRASKAALNQILVTTARNLHGLGVKTLAIHPGWVQTDMGGKGATVSAKASVAGIIEQIQSLTLPQSGSFKAFDGSDIPW